MCARAYSSPALVAPALRSVRLYSRGHILVRLYGTSPRLCPHCPTRARLRAGRRVGMAGGRRQTWSSQTQGGVSQITRAPRRRCARRDGLCALMQDQCAGAGASDRTALVSGAPPSPIPLWLVLRRHATGGAWLERSWRHVTKHCLASGVEKSWAPRKSRCGGCSTLRQSLQLGRRAGYGNSAAFGSVNGSVAKMSCALWGSACPRRRWARAPPS